MMKAIKNFMKKPITWGDSFKWSGIALGLYAAVIGAIPLLTRSGSLIRTRQRGLINTIHSEI